MSKKIDLTGQKFGRLTVMYETSACKGDTYWACRCECGNWKIATTARLRAGYVKSCGCLLTEIARTRSYKGYWTNLFSTYRNLTRACYDKTSPKYADFGEKGITFCDYWRENVEAFMEWSTENGYTPKSRLLRYDQDDGYRPSNCFWWTPKEDEETQQ